MRPPHIEKSSRFRGDIDPHLDVMFQLAIHRLHGSQSEGAGRPAPDVCHCERGTCGPAGCSCCRNVSSTPPPPCPGAPAGACWVGPPVFWMIDRGLRSAPASIESTRLVAKKVAASTAVVRVSTLAVPRLDRNPPVEPMPSPPPSDFCNSTTPIMAATTMR